MRGIFKMKKNKNITPPNDEKNHPNKSINLLDKKYVNAYYSDLVSIMSKSVIEATNIIHHEIYKMYTPYLMNAINISSNSIIKLIESMDSHYFLNSTINSMSKLCAEIINGLNQTLLNSLSDTIIGFSNTIEKMDTDSLNFINSIIESFDFENVEMHDDYFKYKGEKITINDINITINNVNNLSVKQLKNKKRNSFIIGIIGWIFITLFSGFVSKPGSDLYDLIINNSDNNKISKSSDNELTNTLEYKLVIKDELDVKVSPNSNAKNIGKLYYLNVVKELETKPYWTKIEYVNKEEDISIKGWVATRQLKKLNIMKSTYENIN